MVRAESLTATLRYEVPVQGDTYTVDGLRIAQNVDGNVTAFVWDWATGIPEMLSDGDKRYLVGHDTLGWEDAGGWTYAVPDALGSVRQAVDAAGAVVVESSRNLIFAIMHGTMIEAVGVGLMGT
jgi:hypothetical protein